MLHLLQGKYGVSEALLTGQLRECHTQELVLAGERAGPAISPILLNAALESIVVDLFHQLGKYGGLYRHGVQVLLHSGMLKRIPEKILFSSFYG
jgi:hypothetical protein